MAGTPFVKVCCISSLEEARLAVSLGASALGLVAAMPSGPGVIDEALIAEIAAGVPPPVASFLLTSEVTAAAIAAQHARCRTSTLQLVDAVAGRELTELRERLPGIRLVQVIHVQGEDAVREAAAVAPLVDALLLDSGNPTLAVKQLGGTGRTHDWDLSARIVREVDRPVFLAGGLREDNVAEAIERVRPHGLDLCSSVREGGRLSAGRLGAFMRAVREAAAAG